MCVVCMCSGGDVMWCACGGDTVCRVMTCYAVMFLYRESYLTVCAVM